MRPVHAFLAVFVMVLWGLNYIAVPIGLEGIPPIFLSFIRLFILPITTIFFVKKPKAPMKMVFLYGLTMLAMQFGFLFSSVNAGLSPALAALLLQTQVFFTAVFAYFYLKEKLSKWQIFGALIAFAGIFLVAIYSEGSATPLGIALVIAAAISWGIGNVVCKKMGDVNRLSLVVWGSLVAAPPLLLVSLLTESFPELEQALAHLHFASIGSVLYLTFGSLLLGFLLWNRLIYLYPLATIAPFTLLVPLFGALGSSIAFSTPFHLTEGIAFLLVIAGLCVDMYGARKKKRTF